MDFKIALKIISEEFGKHNIRYAIAGGFAMGVLGSARSTSDLDFLIAAEDAARVAEIMAKIGYKKVFSGENVSQYVSDVKIFGEADFLHALRPITSAMLKNAKDTEVFNGEFRVKVLAPEDVIGLKAQSAANDPSRAERDSADIEELLRLYGKTMPWDKLKTYFELFNMGEKFNELKSKYK